VGDVGVELEARNWPHRRIACLNLLRHLLLRTDEDFV
jgi:hypothetical protein